MKSVIWPFLISYGKNVYSRQVLIKRERDVQRRKSQERKSLVTLLQGETLGSRSHRAWAGDVLPLRKGGHWERKWTAESKPSLSSQFCLGPVSSNTFLIKKKKHEKAEEMNQGKFNVSPQMYSAQKHFCEMLKSFHSQVILRNVILANVNSLLDCRIPRGL